MTWPRTVPLKVSFPSDPEATEAFETVSDVVVDSGVVTLKLLAGVEVDVV
jgi:hypothetical protein